MQIVRIERDLAKYVFEVHGVDAQHNTVLRKTLRRDAVPQFFAEMPACVVGWKPSAARITGQRCYPTSGMRFA